MAGKRKRGAAPRVQKRRRTTRAIVVSRGIRPELKFYDTSLVTVSVTAPTGAAGAEHNPSATISLNTVVQGDGESNRDGRQIQMTSIGVRGHIRTPVETNQTVTDETLMVMVALVLDTQTNGALLNSEDVFINPSADALLAAQPWHNLQFSKRFRVLKTQTIVFERSPELTFDGTNMEQGAMLQRFEMFVDLKGMVTTYSAATEDIANIVDNGLNIVAFANSTALGPKLSYQARLRFMG